MKDSLKQLCILTALCLTVLAPYHRLILGQEIPIPSDIFISDLADGDFPLRVEAGRLLRSGESPFWTPNIMTGAPLSVDPISMLLFTLFPPALALGLLYGIFLVVTATGTYTLSRHFGASAFGAFLAGFSFTWSGFFVCQMRHLGIIGTVAFFPFALYCLDSALLCLKNSPPSPAKPKPLFIRWLALFALCFGLQIQAGFPQTVYICGIFYGLLILWRTLALALSRPLKDFFRTFTTLSLAIGGAIILGTLMGMIALLPLWELGTLSDRAGGITFENAIAFPYQPACMLTFICPYYYGDISNYTFKFINKTIFWEVYGYAGMFTPLLALLAIGVALIATLKKKTVLQGQNIPPGNIFFWSFICILSFCLVLGAITPLYKIVFHLLPGFSSFRFPTRFLFVTVLALSLLGGFGLTWLQIAFSRFLPTEALSRNRLFIGTILVAITIIDLVYHNQRQNPMVDSKAWLETPPSAHLICKAPSPRRTYSPDASQHHIQSFAIARGWSGDLTAYYLHRDLLQPNSNLLYDTPSLNAYWGILPRWVVDLIGDHNRHGLLVELRIAHQIKAYYKWLQALSVNWIILPSPALPEELPFLIDKGKTSLVSCLYQLQNPLPRARFAKHLQCLPTIKEIKQESVAGRLDPTQTTLLHSEKELQTVENIMAVWKQKGADPSIPEDSVTLLSEHASKMTLKTRAREGRFLVVADTYYPGWEAKLDGDTIPIHRVNMMHRGVLVPPGEHTLSFHYRPWTLRWGIILSLVGTLSILILICYYSRKTKEALV